MAPELQLSFSESPHQVETFDSIEISLSVTGDLPENPFTGASVTGEFQLQGSKRVRVEGFCDSPDGSMHRIRFMPELPGSYEYRLVYQQGDYQEEHRGQFVALDGGRKGLLRVDPAHPYHFAWAGTGEHFFWNATTTYALLGWDDQTMDNVVDRLADLRVNRLRVGLSSSRVESGRAWYEDVFPSEKFTFLINPWVAERPDSVEDPGFDVLRFNIPFWQKVDRLLRRARERDVLISIIFYVDGRRPGVYPFDQKNWRQELRYYAYAINRLAAFSNVMWDVTNEWKHFRNEPWVNWMGNFIKTFDPYQHLVSCHGHESFPFLTEHWADFAMYQLWDEAGNNTGMLHRRNLQEMSGKPKPVINEEYGYEDHYPQWAGAKTAPARSADNRRRLAWEMTMAGCYQTTGERAVPNGGWINGYGADDTLLNLHAHMMNFFTSFNWWQMNPANELVNLPNMCLAEPGNQYAAYLPAGGRLQLTLIPGTYQVYWFDPRNGKKTEVQVEQARVNSDSSPEPAPSLAYLSQPETGRSVLTAMAPSSDDWAIYVKRVD